MFIEETPIIVGNSENNAADLSSVNSGDDMILPCEIEIHQNEYRNQIIIHPIP